MKSRITMMNRILVLLTIIFWIPLSKAGFGKTLTIDSLQKCQKTHDPTLNRDYFTYTDTLPKFPEGNELLQVFIHNNFKYPEHLNEVKTTIYVSFIVETDGSITFLKFLRPVNFESLEKEVQRILKIMPKWIPAKCDGRIVPFVYNLPLRIDVK